MSIEENNPEISGAGQSCSRVDTAPISGTQIDANIYIVVIVIILAVVIVNILPIVVGRHGSMQIAVSFI